MAGYSARQSSFTTGDTIEAADSNDEFNQILAAFHVSTGHTHDGTTAGDGGPLSTLYSNAISMGTGADTDIVLTFNANTSDGVITWMEDEDYFKFSDDILVNSTEKLQFRDTAIYLYSSADGQLDLVADTEIQIAATTVDINGNVDISGSLTLGGTAITSTAAELNIMDGGTSATSTTVADADRVVYNDAGTMKQVAVTDLDTYISATSKTLTNKTLTSPVLNTGVSGTAVADEDDMSSNSATKLATQQSIKAYVDAQITAEDLDVTSDSGTIAIDLDSETLTIAGGTGLDSSATSNTVTLAIDSTVTTLTGSQTLTNKTLTSPVLNTGVSGTAVLDEDNMASDSATQLATQQSIKAYVDAVSTGVTSFVMEDDDGTEVTISNNKEIKYIGSGLTTNWTDTDNGTDGDPYDLTFTVDAAQTGITSILATDLKIGEDDETKIDFETANEIHFYANNTEQVYLADNIFGPQSDSDVDLGTTGVRWKDAYVDSVTVTDDVTIGGDLTVNGTTTTVNSTTVTIDDPIFTLGGDSAPGSDDNKDRGIEFRWHNGTAAKVGFFGYDDSASVFTFIPDASNSSEVFSGTVGNVAFGNIAGTLTTAAQTNITSVGALDGGSITSGFGTIDTGSSNITTTGLISGGSLDIDDVLINGTTIGHTDDTDLMTLSNGGLVVAGTLEATGNITGTLATAAQTNITSLGTLSTLTVDNVIINGTTIGHTDDTDLMTLASGGLTVAGTIEGTTITASTAVVPDASGGADLGSTSLEWGDVYIADDKKLYLGSDQNFSIEYDENGNDTTAVVAAGGVSMAPHGTSSGNGTELRFQELAANGANYVGFKAPDAIASNEVWVLPNADGNADQVLKTDGSNTLSWADAGGGGEINFVADGAIAAQKPVILTSAGKAQQIAETTSAASTPTVAFTTMDNSDTSVYRVSSAYESSSERYVLGYSDNSNSGYPTIVAGSWSSGTVTWGTPHIVNSNQILHVPPLAAGDGYVFVGYSQGGTGKFQGFSISGTTFSNVCSETVASQTVAGYKMTYVPSSSFSSSPYDPVSGILCNIYSHAGSGTEATYVRSYCIRASSGANNGSTTEESILATNAHSERADLITDPDNAKAIYATFDGSDGDVGKACVIGFGGTASSPTDTVGTFVDFSGSDDADYVSACYDTQNNKAFITWHNDDGSDKMWKGAIGTITAGTNAISYAGTATIWDFTTGGSSADVEFDTVNNKIIFFYRDDQNSDALTYKIITPGASSFSVANGAVIQASDNLIHSGSASFGANKGFLIGTRDAGNSNKVSYASAYFAETTTSNLDNGNYLGVAKAAISDTATGTIVVPGGLSAGHSSLTVGNHYFTNGNGVVGLVGNATGEQYLGRATSTTEIQLLENEGYLYGTAEGAITAGKPVIVATDGEFEQVAASGVTATAGVGNATQVINGTNVRPHQVIDIPGTNCIVVSFMDGSTSSYPSLVAGTIDGEDRDITWGTVVNVASDECRYTAVTYNEAQSKLCFFYLDGDNDYIRAHHATVNTSTNAISATSTYGSIFSATDSYDLRAIYDPDTTDTLVFFTTASNKVYVKNIISTGTDPAEDYGAELTDDVKINNSIAVDYDTNLNKYLIAYIDDSGTNEKLVGCCVVDSGTAISFGTPADMSNTSYTVSGSQWLHFSVTFYPTDPDGTTINKFFVTFHDNQNTYDVRYAVTTLSGTDNNLTVQGAGLQVSGSPTSSSGGTTSAYDPLSKKIRSFHKVGGTSTNLYSFDAKIGTNDSVTITDGRTDSTSKIQSYVALSPKKFIASTVDSYAPYPIVGYVVSDTDMDSYVYRNAQSKVYNFTAENFIGFATKTVADNAQAEVATFGQIDAQQSSLTTGQLYYVQGDGTLGTSAHTDGGTVSVVGGRALSASKLLISSS